MAGQATFSFASPEPPATAPEIVSELSQACQECSLGVLHPGNSGLVYCGPVTAKIAVLSDYPAPFEIRNRTPLFMVASEWERWLKRWNLSAGDIFVTHVGQCPKPLGQFSDTKDFFRLYSEEVAHCMHRRALRVLRSMPNLEVVITLGLPVAKILLGGEPRDKSHIGEWFASVHLPNVAIFCLEHPRLLEPGVNEKRGRIYEILNGFHNLYLRGGVMPELARAATCAWQTA